MPHPSNLFLRLHPSRHPLFAGPIALLALVSGCVATPDAPVAVVDQQVAVHGTVVSIDRTPMAWDGDGLLVVKTASRGDVTVHIPARSNLCKAQGLAMFGELEVGAKVQVAGMTTGANNITVCSEPTHYLKSGQ